MNPNGMAETKGTVRRRKRGKKKKAKAHDDEEDDLPVTSVVSTDTSSEAAILAGRLQAIMNLIHRPLLKFITDKIASISQKETLTLSFPEGNVDLATLLKYVRDQWDNVFMRNSDQYLEKLVIRALSYRNKIAHQASMSLDMYDHAIETFDRLANAIDMEKEIYQVIQDLSMNTPQENQMKSSASSSSVLSPSKTQTSPANKTKTKKKWKKKAKNTHEVQGDLLVEKGKYTEALSAYTHALHHFLQQSQAQAPQKKLQAVLYDKRAKCELRLKKFHLALEDAEDAIANDPQCPPEYYVQLCEANIGLELYQDAALACEKGLALSPRHEKLLLLQRDIYAMKMIEQCQKNPQPKIPKKDIPFTEAEEMVSNILNGLSIQDQDIMELSSDKKIHKYFQGNQTVRKGHLAKEQYKYQEAHRFFCLAADKYNSAEAWYNLALLHTHGQGVARDFLFRNEYLHKAMAQKPFCRLGGRILPNIGVAEAELSIGIAYRDGMGIDVDLKKAFEFFLRSAQHGCGGAQNNVGLALLNGQGVALSDPKAARKWFSMAAGQNIAEAQVNYADMLESGIGGLRDREEALKFYRLAASQGFPGALQKVQTIQRTSWTESPKEIQPNTRIQDKYFEMESWFTTGINCLDGKNGEEKNPEKAKYYFEQASIKYQHVYSQYQLAMLYLETLKDSKKGFEWMLKAAEQGLQIARVRLVQLFFFGHGVKRDEKKALRWLGRIEEKEIKSNEWLVSFDSTKSMIQYSRDLLIFEAKEEMTLDKLEKMTLAERISHYSRYHIKKISKMTHDPQMNEALLSFLESEENNKKFIEKSPHNIGYVKASPNSSSEAMEWYLGVVQRAQEGSLEAQKFVKAILVQEQAIELLDTKKDVKKTLGLTARAVRLWDRLPWNPAKLEQILNDAKKILQDDPTSVDALYLLGVYSFTHEEDALAYWMECVASNPSDAIFHFHLGTTYCNLGRFEEGHRSIERAYELESSPDWIYCLAVASQQLLRTRGSQKQLQKKSKETIELYQRFLAHHSPDHRKVPEALYTIGMLYMVQEKIPEALLYNELAQRSEEPMIRLPMFDMIDANFPPKRMLKTHLPLLQRKFKQVQQKQVVKCPFCQEQQQAEIVFEHQLKICKKRPMICFECEEILTHELYLQHMSTCIQSDIETERSCQSCGKKQTSEKKLSRCGRCKAVSYCSQKCQKVHWKAGHRKECQAPAKTKASFESASPKVEMLYDILQEMFSKLRNGKEDMVVENLVLNSTAIHGISGYVNLYREDDGVEWIQFRIGFMNSTTKTTEHESQMMNNFLQATEHNPYWYFSRKRAVLFSKFAILTDEDGSRLRFGADFILSDVTLDGANELLNYCFNAFEKHYQMYPKAPPSQHGTKLSPSRPDVFYVNSHRNNEDNNPQKDKFEELEQNIGADSMVTPAATSTTASAPIIPDRPSDSSSSTINNSSNTKSELSSSDNSSCRIM